MKNPIRPLLVVGISALSLFAFQPRCHAGAVVFADFEADNWGDWTVEGNSFGDAPTIAEQDPRSSFTGKQELMGWVGKRLATTWNPKIGDGDSATGRLTSPKFKIERPVISFVISGGNYPESECVNLIIDDKIVRNATGENTAQMADFSWDVSEFIGKEAYIEIVDEASPRSPWAHINVDEIRFCDK